VSRPPSITLRESLAGMAREIEDRAFAGIETAADWERARPGLQAGLRRNLGLEGLTASEAPVVREFGTFAGEGYVARRIGFQIAPDCWASAVIFHPAAAAEKSPAVLYLCGHKPHGTHGYQPHGIFWARRGYVCLVLDTIEQADNPGEHHGSVTGLQEKWTSLGFTSAGLEAFNSLRALDVLAADPAVDAGRIGVTGVSGGGAQGFFLAALDERVRAVSSLCGLSSAFDAIGNRHLSGHCDCFYPLGIFPMSLAEIAALVAPRALQFCFGEQDALFHPGECRGIAERASRIFERMGVAENLRTVVADGPHGDHPDFDAATQEWFDRHLAGEARPLLERGDIEHPLETVSVFRGAPPQPNRLAELASILVPATVPALPKEAGDLETLQREVAGRLPGFFEPEGSGDWRETGRWRLEGGLIGSAHAGRIAGMELTLDLVQPAEGCRRLVLTLVEPGGTVAQARSRVSRHLDLSRTALAVLEPRSASLGADSPASRWHRRALMLLGLTPVVLAARDALSALLYLEGLAGLGAARPVLHGIGETGAAAVYAALACGKSVDVVAGRLPASHRDGCAVPGILRTMDLTHAIGLLAPRRVALLDSAHGSCPWARQAYQILGHADRLLLAGDLKAALDHVLKETTP
jgi:dienelactone hydrolase